MKFTYFPGCSLKGSGRAYEESLLAVCKQLGVELEELDDWNCCGATAYMAVSERQAFGLAARNLALAEQQPHELIAPCSACYMVLKKTQKYLVEYPQIGQEVHDALSRGGLKYAGTAGVRHPLDVLVNDIGLDAIKKQVKMPLKGFKVAPYYGCQIVRPYADFDDQHNPVLMDKLFKALGAEVVKYPLKTRCCGGSLTGTLPEAGLGLSFHILREAQRRGANVLATVCPLCQFNLDAYQRDMSNKFEPVHMPIVYFTQLMGLAFGMDAKTLGLQRGIISIEPLLKKQEVAA
ncbi:MAG: CoB--CoM heterodisulfide reductase iron-sulfur subunit B family protein [Verrucomicrobiia bacterium]|jgi:heterodisulfide reductase subunit B